MAKWEARSSSGLLRSLRKRRCFHKRQRCSRGWFSRLGLTTSLTQFIDRTGVTLIASGFVETARAVHVEVRTLLPACFRLICLSENPNRKDREYTAETERWSSEAIASTVWPEMAIDFNRLSSAVDQFLETRMRLLIALNPLREKWGRWRSGYIASASMHLQ